MDSCKVIILSYIELLNLNLFILTYSYHAEQANMF